jgi:hypothetical protein
MARIYVLLLCLAALTFLGCQNAGTPDTVLPELTLKTPQKISEIDRVYQRYAKNKTLVQVRGKIIYQSKTTGSWAFVEDDTAMVLLDFASASPNFSLPLRQTGKMITVEGRVSLDDTVINDYLLIPTTYRVD